MNTRTQDQENDGLTARPKSDSRTGIETAFDTETANLEDARESGYTDAEGNAVETAAPDRESSPTGAYTDVGAGRSSVVKHKTTEHTAPRVGEEQAP